MKTASFAMPVELGPATRMRRRAIYGNGSKRFGPIARRSRCLRTSDARTSSGSSRNWSWRPNSAESLMTACCGRPPTRDCARTKQHAKWCAKRRRLPILSLLWYGRRRRFAHHFACCFVLAQSLVGGLPQQAVMSDSAEFGLHDQFRLDPDDVLASLVLRQRDRRAIGPKRFEPFP